MFAALQVAAAKTIFDTDKNLLLTSSTASGKTERMEATIQYKGEPNHLQFSVTTSKGRVDNTAALKEANRRIVALGGEEVNPDDFRGASTISQKLVWVELEAAKKAAKKKSK